MRAGKIIINPDGDIEAFNIDISNIEGATNIRRRRISYIWPCSFWKRQAFRIIRAVFRNDHGSMAEWTRTWAGPWSVRLASDKRIEVYSNQSRAECVRWEDEHLV